MRQGEPAIANPNQLKTLPVDFIGEGAVKYGLTNKKDYLYPNATTLIELAYSGATVVEPLYIRRPDAYPAPKGVEFRNWNQMDLVPIFDIEKVSYQVQPWSMSQLKEEFAAKNRYYLVAQKENKVVGYVGAMLIDEGLEILTLTVEPNSRRLGVGRELLRRVADYARNQKCKSILLEMREGNIEAQGLYESFGFIQISRRDHYYANNVHALIMKKEL